eukprot:CAMPEP_0194037430 /NCGR_PEP_ID=MMETSP0009_2-20130614/9779_1 /TAXON_ID=210454 /ORGANISM="Grammatophora oceanica, Strain CCMP 410" /LENGTH=250 /DNA_ID=CAMNT_0038679585 /DNA_START=67 /DNA_END=820 /DNA_ORIENTATION=-
MTMLRTATLLLAVLVLFASPATADDTAAAAVATSKTSLRGGNAARPGEDNVKAALPSAPRSEVLTTVKVEDEIKNKTIQEIEHNEEFVQEEEEDELMQYLRRRLREGWFRGADRLFQTPVRDWTGGQWMVFLGMLFLTLWCCGCISINCHRRRPDKYYRGADGRYHRRDRYNSSMNNHWMDVAAAITEGVTNHVETVSASFSYVSVALTRAAPTTPKHFDETGAADSSNNFLEESDAMQLLVPPSISSSI